MKIPGDPMSDETPRLEAGIGPNLKYDLPAGLVVFLVALPLCLGIALASEAPLMSGIVAGIIGGLVIGPLSGSQLSVSGPAAGLAVIVAEGIHSLGAFEIFLTAVVVGGAIQAVLGLVRAGFVAELFPLSVIKGMLAAIGIILILKQIPHALGRDHDYEGDLDFWLAGGEENTFTEIYAAFVTASPGVVLITVLSLAVLVIWEQPFIAKQSWSRIVPGPLVAVLLGVVMNQLYRMAAPSLYVSADDGHLVQLPVFSSVSEAQAQLPFPDLTMLAHPDVLLVGATIAAIASIETLLCVEATDKLDPFKRATPMNRELVAQGVGNMASGFLGGLPITAVIVRSSANVYAGGRTRTSAVFHGLLLLSMVAIVPFVLNLIPLASLAAVLFVVGYKLARISLFQSMYAKGVDQFLPFVVTIVVTVLSDLLTGVAAGFVVGAVMVLRSNFHSAVSVVNRGDDWLVIFSKDVSFLNKTRLKIILRDVPEGANVLIDGSRAMFIDHDIIETVEDFASSAPFRGIRVTTRDVVARNVTSVRASDATTPSRPQTPPRS